MRGPKPYTVSGKSRENKTDLDSSPNSNDSDLLTVNTLENATGQLEYEAASIVHVTPRTTLSPKTLHPIEKIPDSEKNTTAACDMNVDESIVALSLPRLNGPIKAFVFLIH